MVSGLCRSGLRCWLVGRVLRGAKLAGGEGIESAEAAREFGGGQAAQAVEAAEEIGGEPRPFLRVTFHTAGDEIAVGIAAGANAR